MQHKAFRSGNFDTRFVENYFNPEVLQSTGNQDEEKIAALLSANMIEENRIQQVSNGKKEMSRWKKNRI
jgi:propionyl-CoA carboxylase alpha chain